MPDDIELIRALRAELADLEFFLNIADGTAGCEDLVGELRWALEDARQEMDGAIARAQRAEDDLAAALGCYVLAHGSCRIVEESPNVFAGIMVGSDGKDLEDPG